MASLEEGVLVVVVDAAELNTTEVLLQIGKAHEECTIVLVRPASLLLGIRSPTI